MLTDTVHAANNGIKSAKYGPMHAEAAKDEAEPAREGATGKAANALSVILKGVTVTAGIITTLQKLDREGGLAWLGLPRRRSPLLTMALLGAGAVVGAGLALWFAPISGPALRSALAGRQ